jgi:trehalose 6-phosphate synthase
VTQVAGGHAGETGPPELVVVSNRGPLSFSKEPDNPDGRLVAKRGAGGLVSSLGPLVEGTGAMWIAAAISDADREAGAQGLVEAEGFRLRSLVLNPDDYGMAYDVISNATLWFLHHGLYDLPRRPRIDRRWREAWNSYRRINEAFARAVIDEAPDGATVLVQDYHLALVGTWLAQERPDLRAVHFTHTPFCGPNSIQVLPTDVAEELLSGMASHMSCGFHASRWAKAFEACCNQVIGWQPSTFTAPLAPDHDDVAKVAASEDCAREMRWVEELVGDRRLILRVDRIELSKNILRGFLAFEDLLETRPEWRERVVFVALVYPSREGLPEYLAYRQEVETAARRLNETWAVPGWTPVVLDTSDNFPRSVAALRRYDVLLVNPIKDGLNLVAKEGPLLYERDGVLALSREAGAWEELSECALEVNPFDVAGTAEVLAKALMLPDGERAARARMLREKVAARSPRDWLDEQLQAAAAN